MTIIQHSAIHEFEARTNAETIVAQQEEIHRLAGQNEKLRRERNAYRDYVNEMETAVIEFKGQPRTLVSIWEAGEYRKLCLNCRKPECEGEHEETR